MQGTKLILVEGLPGSGKSTTAHLLTRQLRRQSYDARWYYEQQTPHPLPYRAARGVSEFVRESLHDWQELARQAHEEEGVTVLESSFFQHALLELLAHDADARTLDAYLSTRQEIIQQLEPKLIFLHREDVTGAANEVCRARGVGWHQHFVRVTTDNPYSQSRGLAGLAGATEFVRRYQELCRVVLGRLELGHLTVELPVELPVTDREGAQAQMLDFLGVAHLQEPKLPAAQGRKLCGTYRNEPLGLGLTVRFEAGQLLADSAWWPETHFTPLLLNEGTRFEVRGSPLELEFITQPEGLGVRVGGAWERCPGAGAPVGTVLVRRP